jgi:hypothetical protein
VVLLQEMLSGLSSPFLWEAQLLSRSALVVATGRLQAMQQQQQRVQQVGMVLPAVALCLAPSSSSSSRRVMMREQLLCYVLSLCCRS